MGKGRGAAKNHVNKKGEDSALSLVRTEAFLSSQLSENKDNFFPLSLTQKGKDQIQGFKAGISLDQSANSNAEQISSVKLLSLNLSHLNSY